MAAQFTIGWNGAKKVLNLTQGFDVPPSFALDQLRKDADEFGFMVYQRERDVLLSLLDNALANGDSIQVLANAIAESFAEGYHVVTDIHTAPGTDIRETKVVERIPTETWSKMVARTELSRAQTLGARDLYRSAGIQTVMWATTQGENVCDECADADGEIEDIGEDFAAVGTDAPPAHPNCACALLPADESVAYPGAQEGVESEES